MKRRILEAVVLAAMLVLVHGKGPQVEPGPKDGPRGPQGNGPEINACEQGKPECANGR